MTEPQALYTLAQNLLRDLEALEAQLLRLEKEIQKAVPLHVKRKYKRCGKPRCRCARGIPHGPYLYAYVPDEEIKRQRREGKGSTRKEVYLGRNWTPPEGWTNPQKVQKLLREHRRLAAMREEILLRLEKAETTLRAG
ncbi:MAG: DUF6788 family protein [Thermus sp.]